MLLREEGDGKTERHADAVVPSAEQCACGHPRVYHALYGDGAGGGFTECECLAFKRPAASPPEKHRSTKAPVPRGAEQTKEAAPAHDYCDCRGSHLEWSAKGHFLDRQDEAGRWHRRDMCGPGMDYRAGHIGEPYRAAAYPQVEGRKTCRDGVHSFGPPRIDITCTDCGYVNSRFIELGGPPPPKDIALRSELEKLAKEYREIGETAENITPEQAKAFRVVSWDLSRLLGGGAE